MGFLSQNVLDTKTGRVLEKYSTLCFCWVLGYGE